MTKDELYSIIRKNATHAEQNIVITDDTHIVEELNFDSIDFVQMIIDIEELAEIDFLDEDLLVDGFTTVGTIWEMICVRLGIENEIY